MKKKLLSYKTVPRWVILLIDLVIISWSFALSYFIVKNFELPSIYRGHFLVYTGIYCLIAVAVFYAMRIHTGLIRYSNTQDIFRIFSAVLVTSVLYPVLIELMVKKYFSLDDLNLFSLLLINFFIASSFLIMLRTMVKETFHYVKRITSTQHEKVIIYGSGSDSMLIKQALESNQGDSFSVIGFLEKNGEKVNSYIEQKKIYHVDDLLKLKTKHQVEKLIIVNEDLGLKSKKQIIDKCLAYNIKVVTVPPFNKWIYGKLNLKQMKDLNIEDLLQREPIVINNIKISNDLEGKRILITGAAGSIGSEIVRQVMNYNPGLVILCDMAESALHDIQLEIEEFYPSSKIRIFIANVQNFHRMQHLFKEYNPEIVFHAAAYKHVPMMENNPSEAILTNVMGTMNIADLAILHNAEKFVMISTDKAVNPTNVMGASKRIAEIYIQSLSNSPDDTLKVISSKNNIHYTDINSKTKFITTRFGNVLDSNGSVIPRFRNQIQKGGPITVTDPEITRYFMTIPEAVQLVLEAGIMGNGGEIFVFDMGKPVKISDLANKMILLAGLEPGKDIQVVYTGLRPGEKLFEELLNVKEKCIPTYHDKIQIAKVIAHTYDQVYSDIEELIVKCYTDDNDSLVKKMKDMVPEFISNNSPFGVLDASTDIGKPALQQFSQVDGVNA